jgi:phage tail-like protein
MARSTKTDPLRNFKFQVQIVPTGTALSNLTNGIGRMGFSVVSGVSVQNELIAYREGGMNTHPHKMPGQSDYAPVTFSKGVFADESQLYRWQQFLHSWTQANGSTAGGNTQASNDFRADIMVTVYDHPVSQGSYSTPGQTNTAPTPAGRPKLGYKLFNCWPGSYSLTDLNAGDSSIMIQQMVINHEGFAIVFADSPGGQAAINSLATLS